MPIPTQPKKSSKTPFYFCEACKRRHPAELGKMAKHMGELRSQGLHPVLHKQGKSNVLMV